jgi:hypothetical protein
VKLDHVEKMPYCPMEEEEGCTIGWHPGKTYLESSAEELFQHAMPQAKKCVGSTTQC